MKLKPNKRQLQKQKNSFIFLEGLKESIQLRVLFLEQFLGFVMKHGKKNVVQQMYFNLLNIINEDKTHNPPFSSFIMGLFPKTQDTFENSKFISKTIEQKNNYKLLKNMQTSIQKKEKSFLLKTANVIQKKVTFIEKKKKKDFLYKEKYRKRLKKIFEKKSLYFSI